VQVSLSVILLTLPRLIVPLFGGVLTDRVDRRYLGIALDLLRAAVVFASAALALSGHLQLWQLYLMVLLLGVGFAVYWSTSLALLQEIIPSQHLVGANAAVLVAVQGGMLVAGTVVGFLYDHAGLGAILVVDGLTYDLGALLHYLRREFVPGDERSESARRCLRPRRMRSRKAMLTLETRNLGRSSPISAKACATCGASRPCWR
jgi:MFS family permease